MTRAMSDLANSWEVIMISAFVALFASYLYMWLTKRLAGIIIWLCILLVIVGGFFLGYSFLKLAGDAPSGTSDRRVQAYQVSGYLFIAATAVFVLVILGLSSQITIAIEVVKEGSRAINDMKLIIFTPLIPMICACLYFIYWIYGALYIFSVSDLKKKSTPDGAAFYQSPHVNAGARTGNPYPEYDSFDINDSYRPLAAYWLFHMFWSVQFLVYFGYFVIAGAVCGWYFTLSDANGNKIIGGEHGGSRAPIFASFYRAIRYHLGTIAFAALIIAIVQMIRVTVKYIEVKTRSNPPNYLQRVIFCLIHCCLKCIEWSVSGGLQEGSRACDANGSESSLIAHCRSLFVFCVRLQLFGQDLQERLGVDSDVGRSVPFRFLLLIPAHLAQPRSCRCDSHGQRHHFARGQAIHCGHDCGSLRPVARERSALEGDSQFSFRALYRNRHSLLLRGLDFLPDFRNGDRHNFPVLLGRLGEC